ncbi:MAG: hypothetical protein JO257_15320 [Deltaproteobacteria bacterium]|nr:hypothetical protein [Deltaproteobacteria bacterium]
MPTTVLVEYTYEAPLDDAAVDAMVAKLKRCFEIAEVTWRSCYLSLDRKTQIGVFEAPDAHTVQSAHRMLGIEFVRSWPMQRVF